MAQVHLVPLDAIPVPLVRRRGPAHRDAHLIEHWAEADLTLDARINGLRGWTKDVHEAAGRSRIDWCIGSLQEIRDCLSRLRVLVTVAAEDGRIEQESPLVHYVAEAYVWAGDVLDDVFALVQDVRHADGHGMRRPAGSTAEERSYVNEFLDPLQREIEERRAELRADPVLVKVLPLLASLRAAIVALDWGLRTDP